jgi:hypothetical protein
MTTIVKWWRAESALIASIALAIVGAGVVHGIWEKVLLAVLPLIAGGVVRRTVWAPDTVEATVQATAESVASQITPDIASPAGEVGTAAQAVVDGVVAGALGEPPSSTVTI